MHAVFPFRLFGVGKPDLAVARDTFAVRLHPDFKLHAPYQTIVEGVVRQGTVVELRVTPPERASDVVTGAGEGRATSSIS